jgi:hypothetical protein
MPTGNSERFQHNRSRWAGMISHAHVPCTDLAAVANRRFSAPESIFVDLARRHPTFIQRLESVIPAND